MGRLIALAMLVIFVSSCSSQKEAERKPANGLASLEEANTRKVPTASFTPPEIICRGDQRCLSSPLTAHSKQEALWLKQNGFPSIDEIARFNNASDQVLRQAANGGSLSALAMLGSSLAGKNDKEGLALLQQAADRGSIFAYYEIAKIYGSRGSLADAIEAAAFLRVAYILGDAEASNVLQRSFSGFGPVESRLVDERAAHLYKTFANHRKPSPRP